MGLIKALVGSVGGTLADQWKEFFYCESIPKDILVVKGVKQTGKRSTNTKGSDNIISNGSGIVVADGQCMIIVSQGEIVEICSEPGEYTYDKSTEPSIFVGNLKDSVIGVIKTMCRRFTYGGDTGKDQRVYYFNMKELIDNKFGTSNPVPFRVVDSRIDLDLDVSIRCFGVYSYKIVNPVLFYRNVCGNVSSQYSRENIDNQLRTEFIAALQPAFGKLSDLELRPNQIVTHTDDLQKAMNEALSQKWSETRGLEVVSIAIASLTLPEEDAELIKKTQHAAILRDPSMAGATMVSAQAEALKAAASNSSGAVTGLMGVGMINGMGGGMNAQSFYDMAEKQKAVQSKPAQYSWTCRCGAVNSGKFCTECGEKIPMSGWTCKCGSVNKGKFCPECGARKPENAPCYRCDKCGWQPEDPCNPPRFCPECGDPFDENDVL